MPSLAQMEAEAVAWINFGLMITCIPLFGIYAYQTLEEVKDVRFFVEHERRGQEFVMVIMKLFILFVIWMPMSVILKFAASQRNYGLLKVWNFFQIVLIFIVALHLLIEPPKNLIMIFAYAVVFTYFLISLWICERLIQETKEDGKSPFAPVADLEAEPVIVLNDNNVVGVHDQVVDESSAIPMKKVLKS